MSRVEELEERIKELSPLEFRALRERLAEYDAELWDRQFAADVTNGKLNAIADQALKDFTENRTTKI